MGILKQYNVDCQADMDAYSVSKYSRNSIERLFLLWSLHRKVSSIMHKLSGSKVFYRRFLMCLSQSMFESCNCDGWAIIENVTVQSVSLCVAISHAKQSRVRYVTVMDSNGVI